MVQLDTNKWKDEYLNDFFSLIKLNFTLSNDNLPHVNHLTFARGQTFAIQKNMQSDWLEHYIKQEPLQIAVQMIHLLTELHCLLLLLLLFVLFIAVVWFGLKLVRLIAVLALPPQEEI